MRWKATKKEESDVNHLPLFTNYSLSLITSFS